MVLLTVLTVIYTLVVVLVLAISLIRIFWTLANIAVILGRIANGLQTVETHTSPLNGHIAGLNDRLVAVSTGFESINAHLEGADNKL